MKKYVFLTLLCFVAMTGSLASCGGSDDGIPEWKWNDPDTVPSPSVSVKPRYVWIDAGGNFERFANSRDNIKADLAKIKDAGFTDVIVDVRPPSGDVLFKSGTADALTKADVWSNGSYVWIDRTATFDYLQAFIDEGHAIGLKVNAAINTFVGGYLCPYGLGSAGMLFRDSSKKGWATVLNSSAGLVSSMDLLDYSTDYGTKFLNPANSEVQQYVLNILADLAKYNLDGIVLDRCRYDDYSLMSDFSDESRAQFESYIGETVANWPSDIFPAGTQTTLDTSTKYYKQWLAFRAKTIHDFVVKARAKVKSVNDTIRFGAYAGAWYSTYYMSGVNWASPKYDPSAVSSYSEWASADYKDYGYADHLDFIFLGAYAASTAVNGSGEWTIEGFCKQGKELLKGDVEFAAGPDVGNGTGWENGGQSSVIPSVVSVCLANSDGLFVFDLCHIRQYDYWGAFKTGINNYLENVNK